MKPQMGQSKSHQPCRYIIYCANLVNLLQIPFQTRMSAHHVYVSSKQMSTAESLSWSTPPQIPTVALVVFFEENRKCKDPRRRQWPSCIIHTELGISALLNPRFLLPTISMKIRHQHVGSDGPRNTLFHGTHGRKKPLSVSNNDGDGAPRARRVYLLAQEPCRIPWVWRGEMKRTTDDKSFVISAAQSSS